MVRDLIYQGGGVTEKSFSDISDIDTGTTGSFRFDPPGSGIKSSQQVNVDFSKFENSTFFSSAQVNVNVAFDRIINEFPFDGTRNEYNVFLDKLTGFENYVLDSFPKHKGFLQLSGTVSGSAWDGTPSRGTYISVKDVAGVLLPDLSSNNSGKSVLNPGLKSMTIEAQVYPAANMANYNQVICQKLLANQSGFSLFLSESASTTSASVYFAVSSGSQRISTSAEVLKGTFNHVCAVLNRKSTIDILELYVNSELISSSSTSSTFDDINLENSPFVIGSGSIHNSVAPGGISFIPHQTFSGALDEFRFFHEVRNSSIQAEFGSKGIFAGDELKLYFKLNEPTGSYLSNDVALDSSGNSLHTAIANFSTTLRTASGLVNPMTNERLSRNPVLFPTFTDTATLNTLLLTSASLYDDNNPNLITRLIPPHYFLEGEVFDGLATVDGPIVDSFTGTGLPGTGRLGTAQLMSSFLYTWAKEFDELKIAADSFGRLMYIDYDKDENIPDQFLGFLADYYNIRLPSLFNNASFNQFYEGDNLTVNTGVQLHGLQFIQNEMWRRILINMQDIIRSKGTLHSVRSIIRSAGISPDNNFRIREFGGPTKAALKVSRQFKSEVSSMLDFSGSMANVPESLTTLGIPTNKPFLMSPYLSGSRVEVGWPYQDGTFVQKEKYPIHGISDDPDDGLFTSGSFTYEGIYRFPYLVTGSHNPVQSLFRMHVTGSTSPASTQGVIFNLVASSGSVPTLKLYGRWSPLAYAVDPDHLITELSGADIFDGNKWNISFGRHRNDDPSLSRPYVGSKLSSSYFLRCARQNYGKIVESYTTSSFFGEPTSGVRILQGIDPSWNTSGGFMVIGSQSLANTATSFLNDSALPAVVRTTDFTGRVGQMRFWSQALQMPEWREHVVNFKSLGVQNPLVNFNFDTQPTGSFQRLRIDASTDQIGTGSNAIGELRIFDFTQQLITTGVVGVPWRAPDDNLTSIPYHLSASGLEASREVIKPEPFYFSLISSRYDEAATSEKIRPRGFQDSSLLEDYPYAQVSPVYEIMRSEAPTDDTRLSIEFSIIDALNEDIISIFSTLDALNDAIGAPSLLFSPDYPQLEDLREVYFNRLTDKMNLKGFFEFFKWFDTTIGTIIVQLVPRKTNYLGTNFVIESHMLERPKMEYQYSEMYLGENNRSGLKGTIRLQQFVATVKKY